MRLNKAARLDELLRNGTTAEPPLARLVAAARQVEALRPVPPLPAVAVSSARQTFLAQAARMRSMRSMNPRSSAARQPARWVTRLWASFRQAPLRHTFAPTLAAILLVLLLTVTTGIAFTSLGMAAKTSLPGDRLYGYKIAQEDMGLALTFDLPDRVALYVEMVKQRSEELFDLVQAGRPLPAETAARMQQHLQDALRTASQLPDLQMGTALVQIRQVSLGAQVTLKQAEQEAHDDQSRLTLAAAASAVSNASAMAEQGLVDPREFRTQMSALLLMPSGTPVVVMPTATSILFNPPETSPSPSPSPSIVPFPSPSATSLPAEATSIPATPTSTTAVNTPENPPTVPATPSPTSVSAGSTPLAPTVTSTPTPTATQTPKPPPSFPTPTPISH